MIKIMIDSAADISKNEAEEKGVIMIPMLINIGEEEFYDGVNLSAQEFWEKLVESNALPKTSLINAFRFEEAFEKHTRGGDELIVITISSKLSGTYESARQAAEKFAGKVYVIDSLNACVGERLLCDYALRLLNQGLSAKEIVIVDIVPGEGVCTYEEVNRLHTDATVLVNTSPIGMYPKVDAAPIDLTPFTKLAAVVDVIYNPEVTKLLAQAKSHGLIAVNGLQMLVSQAFYAVQHFLDTVLNEEKIEEVTKMIRETLY